MKRRFALVKRGKYSLAERLTESLHLEAEEDGGVRKTVDCNAPKKTVSNKLLRFECIFSCFDSADEDCFSGKLFEMSARLENQSVECRFECRDRQSLLQKRSFSADDAFMLELHEITVSQGISAHNGYYCRVSGLPDMYGASICAEYDSGETVNAFDNQDNFLSKNAQTALVMLFDKYYNKQR
ncbi:MAG: hypothetical protein IJO64_04170 [Clostridia bacterium]|nr:hypothetical protein [Clostridia bacterium]